ncbi:MAG: protease modulator HflC [Clostridiales bacterium]|nr:protease modulator HflC [Clostridiales bacterium]
MKKIIARIIMIIVILAAVAAFSSSAIITYENQYSVVKRFGRIERVIDKAGISLKVPFIDTVNVVPKSIQFYDMPESDVITQDKQAMVVDNYVLWRVVDLVAFNQNLNSSVAAAEGRIDATVYNAIKNIIGNLSQAEVISGRDGELDNKIKDYIGDSMKQYGIELISVETKRLDLPIDNRNAVYERMISERAQKAATYTAEGEAEAQKIRNETDKQVAISISNAEAQAAAIIAEGEAEYMRILASAYNTPEKSEFYTFIRSLEAARASLKGNEKTLILSGDSPLAKIFYNVE